MMALSRSLLLLVLTFTVVACASAPPPTPTPEPRLTISVSGATSVSSVLTALEARFEVAVPSRDLNVLSGTTSSAGVQGVAEGVLIAAALLRPLTEEEVALGVAYAPLGRTAVALIVHPELAVDGLTGEQVRAIYMGEITNWSDVGGPDAPIVVFGRGESESHTAYLRAAVVGDEPFPEPWVTTIPSHSALLTAIESTPNSIGYTVWGAALASGTQSKPLTLDGVSVDDDSYPVLAEMGVGYLPAQAATVQPLLDWLASEEGVTALAAFGALPVTSSGD